MFSSIRSICCLFGVVFLLELVSLFIIKSVNLIFQGNGQLAVERAKAQLLAAQARTNGIIIPYFIIVHIFYKTISVSTSLDNVTVRSYIIR